MSLPEADARILIIGYGNTLRGDDGLGPVAAERLSELLPDRLVQTISCHQLLPELAEPLSRVDYAIFIDACCDQPPGQISFRAIQPPSDSSRSMTHHFDPATLLALARRLFGRAADGCVVTVGGESFGLEQQLSPTVQQALTELLDRVGELVRNRLENADGALIADACPPQEVADA